MFYNIIAKLDEKFHFPVLTAHCDIPCKRDDSISAQRATLSIVSNRYHVGKFKSQATDHQICCTDITETD